MRECGGEEGNGPHQAELIERLGVIALRLLEQIDDPRALDSYVASLGPVLAAELVVVLIAGPTGALRAVALWSPGVAHSGLDSPLRLSAAELAAMRTDGADAHALLRRSLGIPPDWLLHVSQLKAEGRELGQQVVARSGPPLAAREIESVDRLAAVLARAVERRHTTAQMRRADGIKAEFVRTVSHELRTPLNTVIGYADLLADEAFGPIGDDARRVLRRIGDRARGLLEVIAATLDLPGVAGGRLSLAVRPVSVAQILTELEADTRQWRSRHDLQYTWDVPDDLPEIVTDPGKLRVLLKNLIANAVKFTDRGGISVRARAVDGGVEFTVADTGIGIEPEAVHFVFDAFRQANTGTSGQYGGVGLGLYIVRRLVGILGGRLRVESEVGVGSTFHVWLPAGESPAALDRRRPGR